MLKFYSGMIAACALLALGGTPALAQEPVKLRINGNAALRRQHSQEQGAALFRETW